MMSPIEKAARAFCDEWGYSWEHDPEDEQTLAPDGEEVTYCRPSRRDCTRAARATILAFLDGADIGAAARAFDGSVAFCPTCTQDLTQMDRDAIARSVLAALRAQVTPE